MTHLPSAPDAVEGVINLRGGVIPVVDLCKRLNLSVAEETADSRIIVLDIGDSDIGVFVDEVTEVLRVPRESISGTSSMLSGADAAYIDGIVQVGDGLLMLLQLDEALSAESLRDFKVVAAIAEAAARSLEQHETTDAVEAKAEAEGDAGAAEAEQEAPPKLEVVPPTSETIEPAPGAEEEEAGLPFDMELVRSTFEAIAPRGEELVEIFYERLLEQHPGVAPLFEHVDMDQQRAKLLSAIATVVASLTDLDTLVPHLQQLGERHVEYGAEPAHYEAVGAGLLESIAAIAGDAWSEEAEQAWAGAYGVASKVMIDAAEALSAGQELQAA